MADPVCTCERRAPNTAVPRSETAAAHVNHKQVTGTEGGGDEAGVLDRVTLLFPDGLSPRFEVASVTTWAGDRSYNEWLAAVVSADCLGAMPARDLCPWTCSAKMGDAAALSEEQQANVPKRDRSMWAAC